MDLSRQEYPAMLDTLQPTQAVEVLNNRVNHIGRLNNEIAEWLEERRRIEEIYAQAMRKLARRHPPGPSSDLGIFTSPWGKIAASAEAIADSHYFLAQKIEADVERPLRQFSNSNREMQAMSTIQGNLASLARDVDNAQRKADKAKDRDTNRAALSVDDAMAQWASQAPYVFEQLQAADESRCNHLRDVLTQFETHQTDLVQRDRTATEQCLMALLNIDTADEIKTFAVRITGGNGVARPEPTSSRGAQSRSPMVSPRGPSAPSRTSSMPMGAPIPSPLTGDHRSQTMGSPAPEEEKSEKKRGLMGIKRLGTVISRRRQSTQPPAQMGSPASKSRDPPPVAQVRSASPGFFPQPAIAESETYSPPPGPPPNRRMDSARSRNGMSESPLPSPPIANGSKPFAASQLQTPLNPQMPSPPPTTRQYNPVSENMIQQSPPTEARTIRDSEGFNVPAPTSDPISDAQREADSFGDPPPQQYKVDIRNAPLADDNADAETAKATMAETLRAQATPARRSGTLRGRRDVRNTVFLDSPPPPPAQDAYAPQQNTYDTPPVPPLPTTGSRPGTFSPSLSLSPTQSAGSSGMIITPFLASLQSNQLKLSTSETQSSAEPNVNPSLHSSTPTSTTAVSTAPATAVASRATVSLPALTSSIVETVSCWFEHGRVTRAVVVGDLSLGHSTGTGTSSTATIRLDNFPALEKVAANPAFVKQIDGRPGEYAIELSSIANQPITAFKYQVHIDDANLASHAPIVITPTWRVEPGQTSVILAYSLNPAFAMESSQSLTLTNVVLAISLGGGRAVTCLSKPAGTFSKERGLIFWRLPEVTLQAGAQPERVLARFATEGDAAPGTVEAKWEIVGSQVRNSGSGLAVSVMESSASVDPFADADEGNPEGMRWTVCEGARRLVSGNYTAV